MSLALQARLTQPFSAFHAERMQELVFETLLDLSGKTLCGVIFERCRFLGGLRAVRTVFAGIAWFRDCLFGGAVDLSGAVCQADLRLDRSRFGAAVSLEGIEVNGVLDLDDTAFAASAELGGMSVLGSLSMARARCLGAVDLARTQCFGGAWLDRADFAAGADMAGLEVHGSTWLVGARLGEGVGAMQSFGERRGA